MKVPFNTGGLKRETRKKFSPRGMQWPIGFFEFVLSHEISLLSILAKKEFLFSNREI